MKKVDFGMRCSRCNHKIPDRSLCGENGSRIEKTGVCQKCHNEYNGVFGLVLETGNRKYRLEVLETRTMLVAEGE